jgi:hypothetical protein
MSDIVRYKQPKLPSERNFGLVLAGGFAVIGLLPLIHGGHVRLWSLAIAAIFLAAALIAPAILRQPNIWWLRFGLLLGAIVAPIVMAIMFFGVFTPMGAFLRWRGKDLLRLRFDPDAKSYWIAREESATERTMKNQF